MSVGASSHLTLHYRIALAEPPHAEVLSTFGGNPATLVLGSGELAPALEHCLKCSHLFNTLDASGGIGVTERTAYILRVRQLAVAIARAYAGADVEAPVAGA